MVLFKIVDLNSKKTIVELFDFDNFLHIPELIYEEMSDL